MTEIFLEKEKVGKDAAHKNPHEQGKIQAESGRFDMITGCGILYIEQIPQPATGQYVLTGLAQKQLLPDKQVQTVPS